MFKNVRRLLAARACCDFIAFFAVNLFTGFFENNSVFFIFTVILTAGYMFYISSISFENGAKDKRYNRLKPLNAVYESLLSEIPAALLLIWMLIPGANFQLAGLLYDIWQAPFWLLLSFNHVIFNPERITAMHFVILFIIPVIYSVSYYIAGKTTKLLTPENTQKK